MYIKNWLSCILVSMGRLIYNSGFTFSNTSEIEFLLVNKLKKAIVFSNSFFSPSSYFFTGNNGYRRKISVFQNDLYNNDSDSFLVKQGANSNYKIINNFSFRSTGFDQRVTPVVLMFSNFNISVHILTKM